MIVVSVDLHSAITGRKKNLGRVIIYNDGTGTIERGNYEAKAFKASSGLTNWSKRKPIRGGQVKDHPRKFVSVWNLVAKALNSMGY